MKISRKLETLLAVAALGGAIAFLLDPANGRRRRERLARTVERGSNDISHLAETAHRVKNAITSDDDHAAPSRGAERTTPSTEAFDLPGGGPAVPGVTETSRCA